MTADEIKPAVTAAQGGSIITCHVQPNASRTQITGMYGSELKIALKSPPVDGKANKELCRWLADKTDMPAGQIQLLSGQTSRTKRISVPLSPDQLILRLL